MKLKTILRITKTACVLGGFASLALTSSAQAQTTFNGGNLSTSGNWSNGLPTIASGNQGTISVNGTYLSGSAGPTAGQFVAWNVIQTGGTISRVSGSAALVFGNAGNGTTYVVNGASAQVNYSGISLVGSSYTMTSGTGTADTGSGARATNIDTTSSMTFNGGTSTFNREIILAGNGTFTVNGGTVTITAGADASQTGFKSSGASTTGGFFFNGGTTVAPDFSLAAARTATFGGTTAGSLSLANLGTNITLNFLTGSLMSLSITGATQATYESLWSATSGNMLRFNGANTGSFSNFFAVTGNTLTVIPEPSTYAIVFGMLALAVVLKRRRSNQAKL